MAMPLPHTAVNGYVNGGYYNGYCGRTETGFDTYSHPSVSHTAALAAWNPFYGAAEKKYESTAANVGVAAGFAVLGSGAYYGGKYVYDYAN